MVIHEPGDWLTESLRALAAQDYASLQVLALLTGTSENAGAREVLDIVETELPQAVVRYLGSNPGYAAACNTVLQLVQGDSGFFCFLHDDVALAPDAITCLVDELYRSNAGAVGPKIVHWDNPKMIQSVGVAVDRFGVQLPYADDGELDQEQHDAVQDVFVLPGSCLLVRADLFRTVGGFDASVHSSGSDLDLCCRRAECSCSTSRINARPHFRRMVCVLRYRSREHTSTNFGLSFISRSIAVHSYRDCASHHCAQCVVVVYWSRITSVGGIARCLDTPVWCWRDKAST
jgi:GT2 family glycosyltransferase